MTIFAIGIDDIATNTGQCSGWTFFSISESHSSDFESEAKNIQMRSGLSSFHAKDFKRKKFVFYVEFLRLIKRYIESGDGFACCTLLGKDWKDEFDNFSHNVIMNSFNQVGINNQDIIDASIRLASPLFTYQRIANSIYSGGKAKIYIDRDSILDRLHAQKFYIDNKLLPNQLPVVAGLRAYGEKLFPNAPAIEVDEISIVPDESSFLIQSADVLGNFYKAIVFKHLGETSKTNDQKCDAFRSVFGDILEGLNPPEQVTRSGDDLYLPTGAASFTFQIYLQ